MHPSAIRPRLSVFPFQGSGANGNGAEQSGERQRGVIQTGDRQEMRGRPVPGTALHLDGDQEECGANRVVKVTVRSLRTELPPFKKPGAFLPFPASAISVPTSP